MTNWEQWAAEWEALTVEARVDPRRERAVARRSGSVAVVPVTGLITPKPTLWEAYGFTTSARRIEALVSEAVNDPSVKAVVLAIDSPGGVSTGISELAANLCSLRGRKPIVAQVDYLAASAAYWIATSADEIVASPSAKVGSVGAYLTHVDQSARMQQEGLTVTLIAEPAEKIEGNPYEPLSENARKMLEALVSDAVRDFRSDVAAGRDIPVSKITNEWARIFTGRAALSMGMIDKIRTFAETLAVYKGDAAEDRSRQRARTIRGARIAASTG